METMVWVKLVSFMVILLSSQADGSTKVNITLVHSAVPKGAVCLDGSPPAYYYDQGTGQGANSWILHLQGGAWCENETSCISRASWHYGNSSTLPNQTYIGGLLTSIQTINPDFYNWNRVLVMYCDGASFSADVEEVNPTNNLHLRGARIFKAVVEDLGEKGLKDAKHAILSVCSAGGLATMLQCDNFRALLPNVPKVKCVADSGFFIHAQMLPGADIREQPFADVIAFHGLNKTLHKKCMSKMNPNLTPLFLVNSGFDQYQLKMKVVPGKPESSWESCLNGTKVCSPAQEKNIRDFHTTFLHTLPARGCATRGLFIDGCYIHDHIQVDGPWSGSSTVNNKTIAKAVGDWFFDRSCSHYIDTRRDLPYQCT